MSNLIVSGVKWNYALTIFTLFFLTVGILQHIFVDEIPPEDEDEEDGEESHIAHTWDIIKEFLKKPKHLFWLFNVTVISNFYYSILMWIPYYFSK